MNNTGEYNVEILEKMVVREKEVNETHIKSEDHLSRYKTVPIHAIFLYSSQHNYIEDYIIKNRGALSLMSGDYCDLFFSNDQLINKSDAFDEIQQIIVNVDISKLPGVLFWESEISNNCFLTFRNLSEKNITNLLQTVFQQIRKDPKMDSITMGEESFKRDSEKEKASHFCPIPIYMSISHRKFIVNVFLDWLFKKDPELFLKSKFSDEVYKKRVTEFMDFQKESKLPETAEDASIYDDLMSAKSEIYYNDVLKELSDNYNIHEKEINKNHLKRSGTPLHRYKIVPLHAVFLYSSLNNYVKDYIIKNWSALSSISGDYCDLYSSIDQLNNESDAFDFINLIDANVDISKLPGVLFWESEISNNRFLSFRDLSEKRISPNSSKLCFNKSERIRKWIL
jgi:hypothetical protein